jgi:hypothetical protein
VNAEQSLYGAFSVNADFRSGAPVVDQQRNNETVRGELAIGAGQRAATLYSVGR